MRRSAKRSRNAAGKSLADICAAQKALATVGSSVRGGASASMVSSTVAVLPILFFSGLVARNFWKTAPPLAAVPSELLASAFRRADRLRADVSHASLAQGGHGLFRCYVVRTYTLRCCWFA